MNTIRYSPPNCRPCLPKLCASLSSSFRSFARVVPNLLIMLQMMKLTIYALFVHMIEEDAGINFDRKLLQCKENLRLIYLHFGLLAGIIT